MIHDLGDNLIPVLAIGCTFIGMVTWIILATLDSVYKTFCNSRLKERLVERGLSASDIERIVGAGTDPDKEAGFGIPPVPPVKSGTTYPSAS